MKISKNKLKQIIKEELESLLKEERETLARYMNTKANDFVKGPGNVFVVNKVFTGKDGKKYAKFSVYYVGVGVTHNGERYDNALDAPLKALTGGVSGESYVLPVEVLEGPGFAKR